MVRRGLAGALLLALVLESSVACAQASLRGGLGGPVGFGTNALAADDDGSSAAISLTTDFPNGLEFFGTRHTTLFVNNNGNVSFAMPLSDFTPTAFPVAAQPMVAGWWADVDTRATAPTDENRVYWAISPGQFVATWYRVGYFDTHVDRVNSFQIILTDESAFGSPGDFDVEIRYNALAWTTGDASGGSGGLGGTPAQAGFDAGNGSDYYALPGSLTMNVLDLLTTSNVSSAGVWRFQIRSGAVTACGNGVMEPGEECDDFNVTPGDGCGARCNLELDQGEACGDDVDCRSGFCTDAVCCDLRCDGPCDACAADGACGVAALGEICREPVDECDAIEVCDGVSDLCPPDLAEPDGTPCDDFTFCNGEESCQSGACVAGAPVDCGDVDPCTDDFCEEEVGCINEPIPACVPDAGPVPDAGATVDAGRRDGGSRDAATGVDAALDPGTPRGSGLTCDCAVTPSAPAGWLPPLLLAGLALIGVRRRTR